MKSSATQLFLPLLQTVTNVRLGGTATLNIVYSGYDVR